MLPCATHQANAHTSSTAHSTPAHLFTPASPPLYIYFPIWPIWRLSKPQAQDLGCTTYAPDISFYAPLPPNNPSLNCCSRHSYSVCSLHPCQTPFVQLTASSNLSKPSQVMAKEGRVLRLIMRRRSGFCKPAITSQALCIFMEPAYTKTWP